MQCEGATEPKYGEGDIEQNISQTKGPDGSQATSTPSDTSTASDDRFGEIDEVEAESPTFPTTPSPVAGAKRGTISVLAKKTCFLIFLILAYPFFLIYTILSFSVAGNLKYPFISKQKKPNSRPDHPKTKGVFQKLEDFLPAKFKFRRLHFMISCRVGCLSLCWLVVNLCVPKLTKVTLLGSVLWKWSLLATVVSLGWPSTCMAVIWFGYNLLDQLVDEAHLAYYYLHALMESAALAVYCTWVLLAWMFYFRLDLFHNPNSRPSEKYATCTFACLLVGSILCVMKSAVLLQWKAEAIYKRFEARVLMAGFQLYFLSRIVDGVIYPFLLPWRYKLRGEDWFLDMDDRDFRKRLGGGDHGIRNAATLKKRSIEAYMLSKHLSMQAIKKITEDVTDFAKVMLREDDDDSDIIRRYQQKIGADNESGECVTENAIRKWTNNDEAELLFAQLKAEFPSKKINEVPFLKWTVDAHKNCLSLGRTLIDAFAVVRVLDKVLTCCLVGVVVLLWLLVTELATTKMLVVIVSPFLALTFVFGDTCKTFFEGVIFSFVTHPFDVGDRCIIDEVEVEVKQIGILTTTCLKIETKEKMLYPNSDLATKLIFNLEGKPDPADVIELNLSSSTKRKQLVRLEKSIKNFLSKEDQRKFYEKSCRVMVKEIGNNIKVSIYFRHTLNFEDVSHSQFVEKKIRRRSKFFIKIKEILDGLNVEVAG